MEFKNKKMSQLTFKFPFKKRYFEQDFFVSSNNFSAYKLIESWPNWPGNWLNVYGESGSGKTHLSKILEKKIERIIVLDESKLDNTVVSRLHKSECLIIDNFKNKIDDKLFYSLLNHSKQLNNYILINSFKPLNKFNFTLNDLKSRISSFINIGIDLPPDDLLHVIISKSFSEKQITISPKISGYIIKNVERSYDKMFKFLKDVDDLSLSSGKSININLIKKVLNK